MTCVARSRATGVWGLGCRWIYHRLKAASRVRVGTSGAPCAMELVSPDPERPSGTLWIDLP